MGVIEIPRSECIALGVIDADTVVSPEEPSLLGELFENQPETETIADLTAARGELMAALEKYQAA
jgi:hypothetical protein